MDFDTDILSREEQVIFALRALYARSGYGPFKMSKFEEYELYVRNKDFLISDGVITFTDTDGKLLALKPDVTLSIVRSAMPAPGTVQKLYYDEKVYRISSSARGFREITQMGLECIGAVDDYCIGEVLGLAAQSLRLISEDCTLCVSHLGVVGAVLEELALPAEAEARVRKCIGEKNPHELEEVCRACGVGEAQLARLRVLLQCSGAPEEVLPRLEALGCEPVALRQLRLLRDMLADGGLEPLLRFDFSVLSDPRYYNGVAFQGFVRGVPSRVISGGQYDKLLGRMGRNGGAVGFAVYLDLLERLGRGGSRFDADTLLLYDEGTDPRRLAAAVRERTAAGESVSAQRAVPEKLRFRRRMKLTESGVVPLD